MKSILFLIKNDHDIVLSDDQKMKLKVKLESYNPEEIIKVIKNYVHCKKKFIFDDIIKDEIFKKYLNYDPNNQDAPDYLDQLKKEEKDSLMDCHNEIMWKCCGKGNKIYELLVEKLFNYYTIDHIPFWCMSGVLCHDIFLRPPVAPIKVITEMNKKDIFLNLCRAQYKRVQNFKNKGFKLYDLDLGKELNL